jgi:hypothetical protein
MLATLMVRQKLQNVLKSYRPIIHKQLDNVGYVNGEAKFTQQLDNVLLALLAVIQHSIVQS